MNGVKVEKQEGAIRHRKFPKNLIGASGDVIRAWARAELNGEDADIDPGTLRRIKSGEIQDVVLRPKKKGFFLPDGTFVEAYAFQPKIGGDLDEAEKTWNSEEADRNWADNENSVFNKTALESSASVVADMWNHGKRIIEYASQHKRPVYNLQTLLGRRAGPNGYAQYTHEICTDLYLWKKDATEDDGVFKLSWGDVDCLIKFSRKVDIRNKAMVIMTILMERSGLTTSHLCFLFGTKDQDKLIDVNREDQLVLDDFRGTLRNGNIPDEALAARAADIARRIA